MARVLPFVPVEARSARPPTIVSSGSRIGEILVRSGAVSSAAVAEALALQEEADLPLGQLLVRRREISPLALASALSDQSRIGLIDLAASPPDEEVLEGLDPHLCLRLEALPWRQIGGTRIIAIGNPDNREAAAAAFGGGAERIKFSLALPEEIRRAVLRRFHLAMRDRATDRCPEAFSCRTIATGATGRRAAAAAIACAGAAALAPLWALYALIGWIAVINLATTGLRLAAVLARFRRRPAPLPAGPARLADYKRLPVVSILVPLRGEAAIAGELMGALGAIRYPAALLDIKIVLEEDDEPTRIALGRLDLPPTIDIVTVPHGNLMTKPRAMNYALPFCRGSIVGVYDAEDRPDPDQIRAVVERLRDAPPDVACVQGYLDFYNPTYNWLSRCFTIEYAMWFRMLLHGVQRLGIPIPLGGTTVFFRRRALEQVGAWDAHNVTEDADLGMRLARFGYRCEMIPSTTLEEANCHPWRWVGQRSRWLKGYAMTWASHMRAPRALLRDLGWRGFLGFQVLFLGGMTSYLAMPLFWAVTGSILLFDASFWQTLPAPLMTGFFVSMVLGNGLMLAVAVLALLDGRRARLIPWVATLVFYWPLGALAAYRAVVELFLRPFHWQKTEHGHGREREPLESFLQPAE